MPLERLARFPPAEPRGPVEQVGPGPIEAGEPVVLRRGKVGSAKARAGCEGSQCAWGTHTSPRRATVRASCESASLSRPTATTSSCSGPLLAGKVDPEGLVFEAERADTETLNARAAAGDLDVVAVSIARWPAIAASTCFCHTACRSGAATDPSSWRAARATSRRSRGAHRRPGPAHDRVPRPAPAPPALRACGRPHQPVLARVRGRSRGRGRRRAAHPRRAPHLRARRVRLRLRPRRSLGAARPGACRFRSAATRSAGRSGRSSCARCRAFAGRRSRWALDAESRRDDAERFWRASREPTSPSTARCSIAISRCTPTPTRSPRPTTSGAQSRKCTGVLEGPVCSREPRTWISRRSNWPDSGAPELESNP